LSVTQASLLTGLYVNVVRLIFRRARIVLTLDVLRRQESIWFGIPAEPSRTVVVEADEKSFKKWKVFGKSPEETVFNWYPWVGILERGSTPGPWGRHKLWLRTMGVTQSRRFPRVPPLTKSTWNACAAVAFARSNPVVLCTDGSTSSAYAAVRHPAIVQHIRVNHDSQEFTRSAAIVTDVLSGEVGFSLAGTQFIDGAWRWLFAGVPRQFTGNMLAKPQHRADFATHIRYGQWRYMLGACDLWVEFGRAAARFQSEALPMELIVRCADGLETLPPPTTNVPLLTALQLSRPAWHDEASKTYSAWIAKVAVDGKQEATSSGPLLLSAHRRLSMWQQEATITYQVWLRKSPAAEATGSGTPYHERQVLGRCGLHALNHAMGSAYFSAEDLEVSCQQYIDEMSFEGSPEIRSDHITNRGWYSEAVLMYAVRWKIAQESLGNSMALTLVVIQHYQAEMIYDKSCLGIIVNRDLSHWFTFKFHAGNIWLLDSQRPSPSAATFYVYKRQLVQCKLFMLINGAVRASPEE